jgi:hypothetical protein
LRLRAFRQLLPGLGHLLKVLAMCRRGGPRHVPAFCSVNVPQSQCETRAIPVRERGGA